MAAQLIGCPAPVDYQHYESEEAELADLVADNRLAELEDKIERGEMVERTSEDCSVVRKQAVQEFVEEFKSRYFFMMTTYMKDPIYQCTGDELDRLVKEVCGE